MDRRHLPEQHTQPPVSVKGLVFPDETGASSKLEPGIFSEARPVSGGRAEAMAETE
jgi:hypothetical protein